MRSPNERWISNWSLLAAPAGVWLGLLLINTISLRFENAIAASAWQVILVLGIAGPAIWLPTLLSAALIDRFAPIGDDIPYGSRVAAWSVFALLIATVPLVSSSSGEWGPALNIWVLLLGVLTNTLFHAVTRRA